jgi:hypothetical protein
LKSAKVYPHGTVYVDGYVSEENMEVDENSSFSVISEGDDIGKAPLFTELLIEYTAYGSYQPRHGDPDDGGEFHEVKTDIIVGHDEVDTFAPGERRVS